MNSFCRSLCLTTVFSLALAAGGFSVPVQAAFPWASDVSTATGETPAWQTAYHQDLTNDSIATKVLPELDRNTPTGMVLTQLAKSNTILIGHSPTTDYRLTIPEPPYRVDVRGNHASKILLTTEPDHVWALEATPTTAAEKAAIRTGSPTVKGIPYRVLTDTTLTDILKEGYDYPERIRGGLLPKDNAIAPYWDAMPYNEDSYSFYAYTGNFILRDNINFHYTVGTITPQKNDAASNVKDWATILLPSMRTSSEALRTAQPITSDDTTFYIPKGFKLDTKKSTTSDKSRNPSIRVYRHNDTVITLTENVSYLQLPTIKKLGANKKFLSFIANDLGTAQELSMVTNSSFIYNNGIPAFYFEGVRSQNDASVNYMTVLYIDGQRAYRLMALYDPQTAPADLQHLKDIIQTIDTDKADRALLGVDINTMLSNRGLPPQK